MTPELLKRIIADQQAGENPSSVYVTRSEEKKLQQFSKNKEIIVITGVRRCGKSVLLQNMRQKNMEKDYYFNFEDERLITFTTEHFQMLQEIFVEMFGVQSTYYFDEIQNIEKWELFARRLYNAGCKIYITGSNATLLSGELGTRLTGRYLNVNIYPFSFSEYITYKSPDFKKEFSTKGLLSTIQIGTALNLFYHYCQKGGFPEYVKHGQVEYLQTLYESIIYRDIIARHKITNLKSFKELVFYLASNCSKEISYSSLRKWTGLGSATTVADYCAYLEDSFLCFFVNRYNESLKVQVLSPKKIYFIDHELARIVGFRFSEDTGRMFENIVFLELKRRGFEVFYYRENKECDFLIRKNGAIVGAIQVCFSLADEKTKKREYEGLLEVLERYGLKTGYILTEREENKTEIQVKEKIYTVITESLWSWLLVWPEKIQEK